MQKSQLIGNLAAGGAYTIFGLNIVFCKDIANSSVIAPLPLFTLRAIGAAMLFWLLAELRPKEKVETSDLPKIAIASVTGLFIPQVTFLSAITMSTTIDTSILSTLAPIFTMLIAALVLKEPITFKKAAGVLISLSGVLLLIFNSAMASNGVTRTRPAGIVLLLLNALSFATYLGVFRPLISKYSVVTFMKWMFLFSLISALPFSAKGLISTDFTAIPGKVYGEIGFLISFATFVAYFLIPVGQKNVRPTIVSMYSYLQPVIAAVVSIAIGMDSFTWQKAAAAVLVVTGVITVNRSRAAIRSPLNLSPKG